MQDQNKILFFEDSWSNSQLYLYDYINDSILDSLNLDVKSTAYAIGFGKTNGNYEFYFNDGDSPTLQIINANSLDIITSIELVDIDKDIISDNHGYIYAARFGEIYSINRQTQEIKTTQGSGFYEKTIYNQNSNCIISLNSWGSKVLKLKLDDNGNIIQKSQLEVSNNLNDLYFIDNSNLIYFTDYNDAGYYDQTLINLDDLSTYQLKNEKGEYITFSIFYSKNNVLYAYKNNQRKIYCYSIDNLEFIKTIPTRIIPSFIFVDQNNNLITVYNDIFTKKCMVDIMKLP
jgi:hypothetical protein